MDEQILDQLIHHRIRALELDLMPGTCDNVTRYPPTPDWYIYHYCGDHTKTTISLLSQALQLLRAFHDAQPQHEVVTINFELGSNKRDKGGRPEFAVYSPDDLDKLLKDHLGAALFTPADLLAGFVVVGDGPVIGPKQ